MILKKRSAILLLSLLIHVISYGQYDPIHPPNTYRNSDNPNYWKNKLPFAGYWQQDVEYTIKADINEQTNIISATEKLIYWNNSPDTLNYVWEALCFLRL